jgi:ethanolamine-phosphate cytidylyltransferase
VTKSIPYAPYVTQLDWISHFGCKYVVHGDDITSDSSGEDCYRFVKAANRFKVVKRTPSISTTDLVGRMLLCTKGHFIKSLEKMLAGEEGPGTEAERKANGQAMLERIKLYATDETAKNPGAAVWFWTAGNEFKELFGGIGPKPGQRVVYVDGGFDLFSSGHIQFLRMVTQAEEELARKDGWFSEQAVNERRGKGADYGPVFVVAGVHDDNVINQWKGVNYPIMNIYERGLCVLQCRVRFAVIRLESKSADLSTVYQRRCLWRSFYPYKGLSHNAPMGHA